MNISDYSFHDAAILEVKELPPNQIIEFLIDFPVDWDKNIFEHRILRFLDVTKYIVEEIPFQGNPTILEIVDLGSIGTIVGSGRNEMEFKRTGVELITNAGRRVIHYLNLEFLEP